VVRSRFNGPDIGSHRLEAVGPLFAFRSGEHIFGGYDFYVVQTRGCDGVQILSLQESAADSSRSEVHNLLGRVGDFFVDHNVGDIQPSAGLQDPEHLSEAGVFVGG
jgi:hypothetical protein